jgi:hypothetical protein
LGESQGQAKNTTYPPTCFSEQRITSHNLALSTPSSINLLESDRVLEKLATYIHIWVILSIRIHPHQLFGRSTPQKKIIDICGKGVILFVGRLNKNKKLQAGHAMNAPSTQREH